MVLTVVYHHRGQFSKQNPLQYIDKDVHAFRNVSEDIWCYFEIIGNMKDLGYPNKETFKLWWKENHVEFEEGLKEIYGDNEAMELYNYAVRHNEEGHIYIEHIAVSEPIFSTNVELLNDVLREGVDTKLVVEGGVEGEIDAGLIHTSSDEEFYEEFEFESHDDIVSDHDIEKEYLTEELDSEYDSDVEVPMYPKYTVKEMCKDFKWCIGMEFSSLKQFKEGILEYFVLNCREIKFKKNDATRVIAECSQKCGFKILVSKVQQSHTFRLKTLYPEHKCGRVFSNKNAKSTWVARQLIDKLKSTGKITMAEVVDDIRCRFGIGITTSTAIQGRKLALQMVEGDAKKQYSLLWSYYAELKRACTGNTCMLQVDRPSPTLQLRFGRFYVCLDRSRRAFQQTCRPFIGVDGCHLKNQFGGQLLVAVGRDPNDQNLPIAFAVVEAKIKDSWRWFLTLLFDDIGHPSSIAWVILSYQQKGLVPCVEEMMQGCKHRFCVRHLYSNFKKKFGGRTLIRDLMMGAAKATYFAAWCQTQIPSGCHVLFLKREMS